MQGEDDDADYSFVGKNFLERNTYISLSLDHYLGEYGKDRLEGDLCFINNNVRNHNNDVSFCDWRDDNFGTGINNLLTIGDDDDGKACYYISLHDEAKIDVKQNNESRSWSIRSSPLVYTSIVFALSFVIMNESIYRVAKHEISGSIPENSSQFRDIEFVNFDKTRYNTTSSSFVELAQNKLENFHGADRSEQNANWFCIPTLEFGVGDIGVFARECCKCF